MPKANSVHPTLSHLAKSSTSTSPSPAVPNLYPAMEGLYVYTAKRLEAIRLGREASKGGYKPVDSVELRSVALWRAVGAEFMAQVIFVFVGGCSVVFNAGSKDENARTIQTSQGEPDARTRKVTIQSSVLVAWYSMTYLPYGIYLFYIGVTKEDPTVEVKTVRHLVLTLAPFVGTLVDPVIVFYQLGFYKTFLRKLSHFCNIRTAAVNDIGLTTSDGKDTSSVGPSSVCGATRAQAYSCSNKLVRGDSGFRDASDTLQTDGVV